MGEPLLRFVCPNCAAAHTRGHIDGTRLFRCLGCGYQGFGFNADAELDEQLYEQNRSANEFNRRHGIPEDNPFLAEPDPKGGDHG